MAQYQFYYIKSQKSQMIEDGLRKLSFSCEGRSDIFCFVWVEPSGCLDHVQLVFSNKFIEGNIRKNPLAGYTAKAIETMSQKAQKQIGQTLYSQNNHSILQEGLDLLSKTDFLGNLKETLGFPIEATHISQLFHPPRDIEVSHNTEYHFYEVLPQEIKLGLIQRTFVCHGRPRLKCILTVDRRQEVEHVQLLFNNRYLHWGKYEVPSVGDYLLNIEGGETLDPSKIMEEGKTLMNQSVFPEPSQIKMNGEAFDQVNLADLYQFHETYRTDPPLSPPTDSTLPESWQQIVSSRLSSFSKKLPKFWKKS